MTTSMRVGVIGLGSMGTGAAQALLRAGFDVTGCDVDAESRARFEAAGGRATVSTAEAAQGAAALVVMVVNAAQTEAVLFGPGGAAQSLAPGAVIISSATMAPDDARSLGRRAEAAGFHYLDAPMSGGASRAASGQLTIMGSGTPAAFEAARPVLSAIAEKIYELGDAPGVGASFKIVNQLLAGVHIAAACEAMTFAGKLGLDLDKVYEVITASAGNSWMFENRVPHILAGDYRPLSAVDIFTKDLGIVAGIGQKEKFPLAIATSALQMFIATAAAGMGRDDDSSVARLLARITGVALPMKQQPEGPRK